MKLWRVALVCALRLISSEELFRGLFQTRDHVPIDRTYIDVPDLIHRRELTSGYGNGQKYALQEFLVLSTAQNSYNAERPTMHSDNLVQGGCAVTEELVLHLLADHAHVSALVDVFLGEDPSSGDREMQGLEELRRYSHELRAHFFSSVVNLLLTAPNCGCDGHDPR